MNESAVFVSIDPLLVQHDDDLLPDSTRRRRLQTQSCCSKAKSAPWTIRVTYALWLNVM